MKVNSIKAWGLASRPKTLTGAMIPVMMAGAMAWHNGCWDTGLWLLCALFACLMQVAANLINDLYDFTKGTDREDRLGPERACAQGWITPGAMKVGIAVTIVLAAIAGLTAVWLTYAKLPYGGIEFVTLGTMCIVFAFLYTTCMSYMGLGDVLVLVFFGLVPVCGTYYLMARAMDTDVVLLGVLSGIAIDALLVINNYRDRDQDRISGKRTIIVQFGERFGRYYYLAIGLMATVLAVTVCIRMGGYGIVLTPMMGVYTTMHILTWRRMCRINHGKELNMILGETSRNMFVLAVLMSIVIIAA